jgi:hypothetical protein
MGITFNWHENKYCTGEYVIYIGDEVYCHLSESDFDTFSRMCSASGNKLLRRVI